MTDIRIVEPDFSHYQAFLNACAEMQQYINDPNIDDDVGKRESKGFIFAAEAFKNLSEQDFNEQIVDFYGSKRLDEEHRPPSPRDPSRKISPEYFYFIMQGDKIIGSVNARPLPRDEFDIANNLKSYPKWDNISPNGARVTISTVLLPQYRGQGLAGEIKKQFFPELRKNGIEEVAATVEIDNTRSNNAQRKLINNFGGRSYQVSGKYPNSDEMRYYNRYIVNTDISGNSKHLYQENQSEDISERISALRGRIKPSVSENGSSSSKPNISEMPLHLPSKQQGR